MPWLPLYLYDDDVDTILGMLNDDPDMVFIVSDGPSRWKAVATLTTLLTGRYTLWHLPTGPLPLLGPARTQAGWVEDPWQGWREQSSSFDGSEPYFGSEGTGILWFNHRNTPPGAKPEVRMSSFEWIGHHYDMIGFRASAETDRWWKRLRMNAKRIATKVPRGGPTTGTKPEIYALPGAIRAFERGVPAAVNP